MGCSGMTWGQSIGAYMAYNCVASSYIFSQFALSHSHLPVSGADEYLHWVEYAAGHTINVNGGNWFFDQCVDWWMEYLNYQIEHHLFPGANAGVGCGCSASGFGYFGA